jgi:uroporphyrin-III C-methyltransferase/precorrin-2 dehydrogenase/sirohydrochlorin ferrochelatase
VRLRLERVLPDTLGALARALEAARPMLRQKFPDGADRRRVVDAALREGGALNPFDPVSFQKVGEWIEGTALPPSDATHEIILTSPDPEELTLRQARLLGEADILLLDGDVPAAILARARADAERRLFHVKPAVETGSEGGLEGVKHRSEPRNDGPETMLPAPGQLPPNSPGLTLVLHWRPGACPRAYPGA